MVLDLFSSSNDPGENCRIFYCSAAEIGLLWNQRKYAVMDQGVLVESLSICLHKWTRSSPKPVLSGVPQGSILGPMLFLRYINDIIKCINANLRLFADDCILYSEIRSSQDCLALQNDLDQLSSWSKSWQLNRDSFF